jgi:uncharacterized protein (TIGR02996 family)
MASSHVDDRPCSELLSLLIACKDAPRDHQLRLILADYLEDQNLCDHALCLRLSVRCAHLHPHDPRWKLYRGIANDPLSDTGQWLAPLRRHFPGTDWYNGLLRIQATAEQLADLSPDDIPDRYRPWLETLRLRGVRGAGVLRSLMLRGWFLPFTALDLRQEALTDHVIHPWLAADNLSGLESLRQLDLSYNRLGPFAIDAIIRAADHLPALRVLEIAGNRTIGDSALRRLVSSQLSSRLSSLDLSSTGITPEGFEHLANAVFPSLETLDLSQNSLGRAGIASLICAVGLRHVRHLNLQATIYEEDTYAELGDWPEDWPLERLDLSSNDMSEQGAIQLGASPLLRTLRLLYLTGRGIRASGLEQLLKGLPMPRLEQLALRRCQIGDDGAKLLANCEALAHLRELDLDTAGLGPEGVAAMSSSPHLRALEFLNLSGNVLGPIGYRALVTGTVQSRRRRGKVPIQANVWPSLTGLDLQQTRPGRSGLETLAGSGLCERLEYLRLSGNRLYAAGVNALTAGAYRQLRALELHTCAIGDAGIAKLTECAIPGRLVVLNLGNNRIGDAGILRLTQLREFEKIKRLELQNNRISDAGAEAILGRKSEDWNLLDLLGNPVSAKVAQRLHRASALVW